MLQKTYNNKYPFSPKQMEFFAKEIKEAGGFDELMIKRQALQLKESGTSILTYDNIQEYREKYLTGIYESLCPFFNTKVPYSFWCQLYITLKKNKELGKLL